LFAIVISRAETKKNHHMNKNQGVMVAKNKRL
jgi:hypothetical protein